MRSRLLAGLGLIALWAGPVLGGDGAPLNADAGQAATGGSDAAKIRHPDEMLGKTVRLQDGKTLGQIADVLLQDGRPSAAVVAVESQKNRRVTVAVEQLTHQDEGEYLVALTEPEIRTLAPYNGPKEGQTSTADQKR